MTAHQQMRHFMHDDVFHIAHGSRHLSLPMKPMKIQSIAFIEFFDLLKLRPNRADGRFSIGQ